MQFHYFFYYFFFIKLLFEFKCLLLNNFIFSNYLIFFIFIYLFARLHSLIYLNFYFFKNKYYYYQSLPVLHRYFYRPAHHHCLQSLLIHHYPFFLNLCLNNFRIYSHFRIFYNINLNWKLIESFDEDRETMYEEEAEKDEDIDVEQ